MATVTFHSSMPVGLRLQALFSAIVSSSVSYGTEAGMEAASFRIMIYQYPEDALYAGPNVSEEAGEVSYLRFGPKSVPWLTLGALDGPVQFTYTHLTQFHGRGAITAAAVLAGSDDLIGSAHGDYIEGYDGNDLLDGGGGADTLDGGTGNDTYIVDHKDDRIVDAAGGGYDVIQSSASFAMAPDAEIEELKAATWASSLSLIGNDFRNLIAGTSGSDELDGKGGVDTLIGGAGQDLYIVDSTSDVILESNGSGYDTVVASASYSLGDNLENLKAASGSFSVTLIGNALPNQVIGNTGANEIHGLNGGDLLYGDGGNDNIFGGDDWDVLYGGMGNDRLDGGNGNDALYGDVGNDVLKGGAGNDDLYGGAGNDSLYSSDGDDRLYGDVGKDTIDGGGGNDRLYGGTNNNRLSGQTGHDTLYGGMHIDTLFGGDGNDRLYGDAGNDSLDGGLGKDILSGGWGRDTFTFRDTLNAKANADTIKDFSVQDDTIRLENNIFRKLVKTGSLNSDFFTIGSKAQDGNDYVIYNKKSGYLYYDSDGSGSRKAIAFAKLKTNLAMSEHDFHII
jgi:Ca2+-binding RTX toxin-like protein